MAKLSYTQLKRLPQYKLARKMYYKKFPICVRFFSGCDTNRWQDPVALEQWRKDLMRYGEVTRWLRLNLKCEYRTRHDAHLAVYLPDIDALSRVFTRYKNIIETIEAPSSEKHNDTMLNDINITIRDKLFYRRYRYKVSSYLYRNQMDQWLDLLDTCESSFEEGNYKFNPMLQNYVKNKIRDQERTTQVPQSLFRSHRWLPYAGTSTVYLSEYDDVCTLHLMFKNIITDTTKIILASELE